MAKKVVILLTQAVAVCVLTMVFGEIYVRVTHKVDDITPKLLKEQSLEYKASVFARHVFPQRVQDVDHRGWLVDNQPRHYRINGRGYRGPDFAVPKPQGTVRVIIYGGSHVFDPGASNGEDWPNRIQQAFLADGQPQVEVINAGIPGHASFDSTGRLFAEGHHFTPDYVVLNNAWNDIKRLYSHHYLLRDVQPHDVHANPLLSYQNPLDRALGSVSLFYIWLRQGYLFKKYDVRLEGATEDLSRREMHPSAEALEQYELTLNSFVDIARNAGAVPVLMIQPRLFAQPHPDGSAEQRRQQQRLDQTTGMYPRSYILESFARLDEITARVAAQKHVELINPNEAMREGPGETMFRDHVHLSPEGSLRLGQYMKTELEKIMRATKGQAG